MSNGKATTDLTTVESAGLQSAAGFELIQRVAKCLASSALVPEQYRGAEGLPNAVIAIELANRMGLSPLMVMQNLYVISGRPAWSSAFIVAAINSTGRYSPLQFRMTGERGKDSWGCVARARYLATGDEIEGPEVTIGMAKAEGWLSRKGSKWQTMPEVMLRYRAASFFGRLYAPEVLMGVRPLDEYEDIAANEAQREAERRQQRQEANGKPAAAPAAAPAAPAPALAASPTPIERLRAELLRTGIAGDELDRLIGRYGAQSLEDLEPLQVEVLLLELRDLESRGVES